jgi:hypothetical protein
MSSSRGALADATNLKLRFSRSLGFSQDIKCNAVYLGKSAEFAKVVSDIRERAEMASFLHTDATEFA